MGLSGFWMSFRVRVLVAVGLVMFGCVAMGYTDSSEPTCWKGPVPDGVDPCKLLEQARTLQGSLTRVAHRYSEELADGLDVERSLRIQEGLLREHLAWQNDHLTAQQIDLLVFVSVAVSLEGAEERLAELEREIAENDDSNARRRLESVALYSARAWTRLSKLSSALENLRKSDLEFGV
jgi:hypothetical protein